MKKNIFTKVTGELSILSAVVGSGCAITVYLLFVVIDWRVFGNNITEEYFIKSLLAVFIGTIIMYVMSVATRHDNNNKKKK